MKLFFIRNYNSKLGLQLCALEKNIRACFWNHFILSIQKIFFLLLIFPESWPHVEGASIALLNVKNRSSKHTQKYAQKNPSEKSEMWAKIWINGRNIAKSPLKVNYRVFNFQIFFSNFQILLLLWNGGRFIECAVLYQTLF